MNEQLQVLARNEIKEGLAQLPNGWQLMFKRMYANGDLNSDINDVVDTMSADKLDWAMQQVQRSLVKARGES